MSSIPPHTPAAQPPQKPPQSVTQCSLFSICSVSAISDHRGVALPLCSALVWVDDNIAACLQPLTHRFARQLATRVIQHRRPWAERPAGESGCSSWLSLPGLCPSLCACPGVLVALAPPPEDVV